MVDKKFKHKSFLILFIIFTFVGALFFDHSVLAASFTSYQNCLDKSGGHSDIPSVQWACAGGWYNTTNYCSLWIAHGSDSTTLNIPIDSLEGVITVKYYGMCTRNENTTDDIWIKNDNNSIDASKNLKRGLWGSPGSLATTLDIEKFVSGLSCTQVGDSCVYSRTIQVWRSHGGNASSTSYQNQTINLIYTAPTPPFTFDGETSLDLKVKNENVEKYNLFTNAVYAKPNDHVVFKATYAPAVQYAYTLDFVDKTGWNNAFNLKGSNINKNYLYEKGDTTTRTEENSFYVSSNDVGKTLTERAKTNENAQVSTTPKSISIVKSAGETTVNINNDSIESSANVYVPYNFINTTSVKSLENSIVYAGEKQSISFNITTSEKYNAETDGTYATIVKNAKWKLNVSYTDETGYHDLGSLENTGNLTGAGTVEKKFSITIPDITAGSKLCVQSSVYPATSGADTNWSDEGGDHAWSTSGAPTCYTVAKRPHLEIRGGNVYSNSPIITKESVKYDVAGYTEYNLNNNNYNKAFVFGSWGELGVIANNLVSGFSSGARIGYNLGSNESVISFCNRVPLTFANYPGCNLTAGYLGKYSGDNSLDKTSILNKFISETSNDNLNNTTIVHDINITIDHDLKYDDVSYTNFSTVPKLLIYADDTIYIKCNVSRIDGILVAKKIITCSDGATSSIISDSKNSNQLVINGAIITDELIANRTYGATKGSGSVIPSEIINFDPTLYRWEITSKNTTSSGSGIATDLVTTYQKELSPRF